MGDIGVGFRAKLILLLGNIIMVLLMMTFVFGGALGFQSFLGNSLNKNPTITAVGLSSGLPLGGFAVVGTSIIFLIGILIFGFWFDGFLLRRFHNFIFKHKDRGH